MYELINSQGKKEDNTSQIEGDLKLGARKIGAAAIVRDIRAGMHDPDLMDKYNLSASGLQKLLRKLVEAGIIEHDELYASSPAYKDTVDITHLRLHEREEVTVPLPIISSNEMEQGLVRDISATGLRTAGISVLPGETRGFSLPVDHFIMAEPILFEAVCKWAKGRGTDIRYVVAGWEITNISEKAQEDLNRFVKVLRLGD